MKFTRNLKTFNILILILLIAITIFLWSGELRKILIDKDIADTYKQDSITLVANYIDTINKLHITHNEQMVKLHYKNDTINKKSKN